MDQTPEAITGQFAHWTRPDMIRVFEAYQFNFGRIARMTGRTVKSVKAEICCLDAAF